MLTFQALKNGVINVFGGNQTRPNIHIQDMVRVYKHFLNNPDIDSGCYNAGFENISILDIANLIKKHIDADINVTASNDPRSYRQDSSKLLKTGFSQKYSVESAIKEIKRNYLEGLLKEDEKFYTVNWMKKLGLDSI